MYYQCLVLGCDNGIVVNGEMWLMWENECPFFLETHAQLFSHDVCNLLSKILKKKKKGREKVSITGVNNLRTPV